MRTLNLDRFEVGIEDSQDPKPRYYGGRYEDHYDDGDWMELRDEEKQRLARFDLLDEEDDDE